MGLLLQARTLGGTVTRLVSGTFERPDLGRLEIVHVDEDFSLGTLANYLIGVWRGEVGLRTGLIWTRALNALHAAVPDKKLAILSVLEPSIPGPVPDIALAHFTESIGRLRGHVAAMAVAYSGEGFAGATMRSQAMAVTHDSKSGMSHVVYQQLEPACAWLAKALNDTASMRATSLCNAVSQLQVGARSIAIHR